MIAKNKKSSFVFTKLAMCSFSIFALAFLSSTTLFNHSAYAAFSISIGSNGTVDLGEITPSPSSGLVSSTATDNVSISTNCLSGYNIYATGTNGNSTDLVDTKHGSTISTSSNTIASPAALANNTWGLVAGSTATGSGSIPGLNSGTPESFSGLPAYTTDFSTITPIYTAVADTTSTIRNDNIPIYYGIKVNTDTTPGNYTSSVLYTAIMNGACLRYTLNFDGNGATENNLQDQTINFGESVDLANFSSTDKIARTGHKLIGWKIKIGDTTSETVYPTDTNMVLDNGISSEVTLVAEWQVNSHTVTINKGSSAATVTGAGTYNVGDTVTISATANPGYHFDYWTVEGDASIPACSATVHPTATTGCKMADGRIWILGNSGNEITWNDMFTGATNTNNHDATVKSGICPAGYSAPKITDYDTLVQTYGGTAENLARYGYRESTGALYSMLGLTATWASFFWSSTEYSSRSTYGLFVDSSDSRSSNHNTKSNIYYVLCYQEDEAAPISTPIGNPATFTMPDSDVTLTANGALNSFTLNYNANSGSGTTSSQTVTYGTNVTLRSNGFTAPSGKKFKQWGTSTSGGTTYSAGASVAPTTLKSNITTTNGGSVTLYAIWEDATPACSATVHPTTTTGCKMADNKIWILGNSGNYITWYNMFTGATGANNHDATVNSGICPAGYSAPKITDFDSLIIAYGGTAYSGNRNGYRETTGALYSVLGLSGSRNFWSSTENSGNNAYRLYVNSSSSSSVNYSSKTNNNYVLCYK